MRFVPAAFLALVLAPLGALGQSNRSKPNAADEAPARSTLYAEKLQVFDLSEDWTCQQLNSKFAVLRVAAHPDKGGTQEQVRIYPSCPGRRLHFSARNSLRFAHQNDT